MTAFRLLATLTLLLLFAACSEKPAEPAAIRDASLILVNGRVYTLDWEEPDKDGRPASGAPRDSAGWYPDAQAVAIRRQ